VRGGEFRGREMRVVAVAKEELGTEEFQRDWWKPEEGYELYYDVPQEVPLFRECNGNVMTLVKGFGSYFLGGKVATAVKRVKEKGIKGNMDGEGLILGSLLVIDKEGKLILHHKEMSWGDHPSDEDLKKAMEQR